MRTLVLTPEQSVDQIILERNGRGFVYLVRDKFEKYILISQRLHRIAAYLRHNGIDDVRASSLYDAILRCEAGQQYCIEYKHRWLLSRLPLVAAVDRFRHASNERLFENRIILGTPHQYKVSRPTE
jgi:hypothetical protein